MDGNESIGLGHVSRCINLARGLSELGAATVIFATRYPAFLRSLDGSSGFNVIRIPPAAKFWREMKILLSHFPATGVRCVVFDIGNINEETVRAAREFCDVVCTVDDRGAARGEADFIFNTVIDGLDSRMTRVGGARKYHGGRYLFLSPEIREIRKRRKPVGGRVEKVLVAMGGSDPRGLTPKVMEAIRRAAPEIRARVIISAGFSKKNIQNIKVASDEGMELILRPRSILPYLSDSDIGVTSGGVTLTEMAAVGMPAVVLSQGRYAHTASLEFEKKGCCILLGRGSKVSVKNLSDCLAFLMEDSGRRRELSRSGRRAVDGRGIYRVGKLILDEMKIRDRVD
ncbi:MAG: hypothetical protein ABIH66_05605 [bacterium]